MIKIQEEDKGRTLNIIGTAMIVLALIIAVNAVYSYAQNETNVTDVIDVSDVIVEEEDDKEVEIVTDTGEAVDVPTMVTATENMIQSSSALIIAILGLAGLVVKYFGDRFMSRKDQEKWLLGLQQGQTVMNKALEEKALMRYILTDVYNRTTDENQRKELYPKIVNLDEQIRATTGQLNYYKTEAGRLLPITVGLRVDPNTIASLPRESQNIPMELARTYSRPGGDINR
jgi:archaellum component FlaF (FlaF/FlaG flagellin family)